MLYILIEHALSTNDSARYKVFLFFCNRHETYLIKWLQQAEILDAIQISMWRIKRHLGEHLACRTGVIFLGFQANGSRRELGAKCESVEGLNVKTVLNVMTFGPKCNKVLNVTIFGPKWNKVPNVISLRCNRLTALVHYYYSRHPHWDVKGAAVASNNPLTSIHVTLRARWYQSASFYLLDLSPEALAPNRYTDEQLTSNNS